MRVYSTPKPLYLLNGAIVEARNTFGWVILFDYQTGNYIDVFAEYSIEIETLESAGVSFSPIIDRTVKFPWREHYAEFT